MELALHPKDIFPPAVPQSVNSVKGENEITLIWSPNLESDLKGYHVYRSTEKETGFVKLTDAPLTKNAFTNGDVQANKTYYYKITAEDSASPPNESDFSETVAEKLP